MRLRERPARAFTVVELLVSVAIVAVLAALLLSSVGRAKDKVRRTSCASHLKQICLGLMMYVDDSNGRAPNSHDPVLSLVVYKKLMKSYVGQEGSTSGQSNFFSCPSDTFYYDGATSIPQFVPHGLYKHPVSDFSSYAFNGGNDMGGGSLPGIAGRTMGSIQRPARTVLVAEGSAFLPFSWHRPKRPFSHENAMFNDAMNMVGFVDGHVGLVPIFWDRDRPGLGMSYDPPPSYDYQWSPGP
jgi:prepilin-type N-terminal cleavage/methylation domain-containing protein